MTFKKLVLASLLTAITTTTATTATAATFSTTVDVTKELTPISMVEKSVLTLPQIRVDESTPEDANICSSDGTDWHPGKNYCTGAASHGVYTITGSAFSSIRVVFPTSPIVQDGLSFTGFAEAGWGPATHYTIGADGTYDVIVRGYLAVSDRDLVTTKAYVFDFDLTTTYN